VPWTVTFGKPGSDGNLLPEDPNLGDTLAAEAPGILAWAVRGAVAFANGQSLWPFPAAVRVKTDAYRAQEDKLGAFVAARVIFEKGASVALNELHSAYLAWCFEENIPEHERFKSIAFGNYFEDRDQRIRRGVDSHHRAFFGGVRLAPDDEAVASVASARHFPDFPAS